MHRRGSLKGPINELLSLWGATVYSAQGGLESNTMEFWVSAPNIDVMLLITTLSLLLISLISAWRAGEKQQTELFSLSSPFPSHPSYSHTL